MEESYPNRLKTLWEKKKLLIASNFSFSHSVFKRLVSHGRQKVSMCHCMAEMFFLNRVFQAKENHLLLFLQCFQSRQKSGSCGNELNYYKILVYSCLKISAEDKCGSKFLEDPSLKETKALSKKEENSGKHLFLFFPMFSKNHFFFTQIH